MLVCLLLDLRSWVSVATPPGVSFFFCFQRLDAIPPIVVATCVSFPDHAPFLVNETEAETCERIYISSRHLSACVSARGTQPILLPPRPLKTP